MHGIDEARKRGKVAPDSPEFNPDDPVWNFVQRKAPARTTIETKEAIPGCSVALGFNSVIGTGRRTGALSNLDWQGETSAAIPP